MLEKYPTIGVIALVLKDSICMQVKKFEWVIIYILNLKIVKLFQLLAIDLGQV